MILTQSVISAAEKERLSSQQLLPVRPVFWCGGAHESCRGGAPEVSAEQSEDFQGRSRCLRPRVSAGRSRGRVGPMVSEYGSMSQRACWRRRVLQFGVRRSYTTSRPRAAGTVARRYTSCPSFSPTLESSSDILR